jgi:hypothetical protein
MPILRPSSSFGSIQHRPDRLMPEIAEVGDPSIMRRVGIGKRYRTCPMKHFQLITNLPEDLAQQPSPVPGILQ